MPLVPLSGMSGTGVPPVIGHVSFMAGTAMPLGTLSGMNVMDAVP